ncbi:MAG: divalent-cation tolerance protein CutA [Acidimicrobiales bacterium]
MRDEPQIVDVTITAPDADWLAEHCRNLIEQRLAASANIIPAIKSIYRWQGKVEEGSEAYAILHTTAEKFDEICRLTNEVHPYETVHIIATAHHQTDDDYRQWVSSQPT